MLRIMMGAGVNCLAPAERLIKKDEIVDYESENNIQTAKTWGDL